eukprot:2267834-Amphidinium_carterae.3
MFSGGHYKAQRGNEQTWQQHCASYCWSSMAENKDSCQACAAGVGHVTFTKASLSSFVGMLEALPNFRGALRKNATMKVEDTMQTKLDVLVMQNTSLHGQAVEEHYHECLVLVNKALEQASLLLARGYTTQ